MILTVVGAVRAAPSKPSTQPSQSQVFQFALENGMQVVVIPDHRAPVVTQMLWFKVARWTIRQAFQDWPISSSI
jgi:zinc protease